jgi:hypothetical protein
MEKPDQESLRLHVNWSNACLALGSSDFAMHQASLYDVSGEPDSPAKILTAENHQDFP